MASTILANDIRQLFAETVLQSFGRLEEAEVKFTFDSGDIYLSTFAEAMEHLDISGFLEHDPELLSYAQVFERFVIHPKEIVDPIDAAVISASLYWLAGYSANAFVVARSINSADDKGSAVRNLLLRIFSRRDFGINRDDPSGIYSFFLRYVETGSMTDLAGAITQAEKLMSQTLSEVGYPDDYVHYSLAVKILQRLKHVGFWSSVREYSSAEENIWRRYIDQQLSDGLPVFDLWPSQRSAIKRGLLDGKSSLVIRTPTSSGKTKMTELAFVNDLSLSPDSKCLYLAPFRALVGEVETQIGDTIAKLGFPVTSLYGGSDANQLEVLLSQVARLIIATPEKIEALHRITNTSITDYQLIVLDEGDLIASLSRGARFEFQLAKLKSSLQDAGRAIFISAVLPNADEIATWLAGSSERLVTGDWQPTTMRVGVVTWPESSSARLAYFVQTGQPLTDGFFVPRLLEKDEWKEVYPPTGFERTYRFPEHGDNGKIAAALAFQLAKDGPVIIFSRRPDWANSIGRKINERLSRERPITTNLISEQNHPALQELAEYIESRLGSDNLLSQCIRNGFAIHHSGVPQSIRLLIEDAYRQGSIKLLIATNTIPQGVNFPARTIIVHSTPLTNSPIRDFWNLAGRAGRALIETQGDILILATGQIRKSTLDSFLDKGNVEAAESVILRLVRALIDNYLHVTNETIESLQVEHEEGENFLNILREIDRQLIDILAEDAEVSEFDLEFEGLVENLFASYQSGLLDLELGTTYRSGVTDLMQSRRIHVLNSAPEGSMRRRFARTGLFLESCLAFEEKALDLAQELQGFPDLSIDAIASVLQYALSAKELEGLEFDDLITLTYLWINTGNYHSLFTEFPDRFDNIEDVVSFVEKEFNYRLPWVLDGLIRLTQDTSLAIDVGEDDAMPVWFSNLPAYLRYGVNTPQLAWVMSIGVADRPFAEWILQEYEKDNIAPLEDFRMMVNWLIKVGDRLISEASSIWPSYFSAKLSGIVTRYSNIVNLLNQYGQIS